jgi:uncharacterized protein YukE
MSAAAPTNELEHAFASFPGWLQAPLRPIFDKMNEGLEWVAGEPQLLVSAGDLYVQLGQRIHDQAQQQLTDRNALNGHWKGPAYDAFQARMADVEAKIAKLADATTRTKEVLQAAAQTAVDSANMIIDLIVSVLALLLAETAINLALSVITFGASLAAEVAEAIAEMMATLARIMRVVEKVAQVLEKLVTLFEKLATIFRTIETELKSLRLLLDMLKSAKTFYKSGGQWAKYAQWAGKHAAAKAIVSQGIHLGTGGVVKIPGMGGSLYGAGKEGYDAWEDSDKAVQAASDG